MSTPHRGTPTVCSNNPEEFIQGGGLYPGGTGIFKSVDYCLWDYGGKMPPNSVCAVRVTFSPTDGSNEGKDELIFWSVGPASEYSPDQTGGFCFALGTKPQIADSSNWHFVAKKFTDNCGMAANALNGPTGIKGLQGSRVTLTRMDQPERNIPEGGALPGPVIPGQPARKPFKPTILVPTAAVFAWDGAGGVAVAGAPVSAAAQVASRRKKAAEAGAPTIPNAAPAMAPGPMAVPQMATPAPTPAPVNGATAIDDPTLGAIIHEILTTTEGNALELKDLPMKLTEKLGAGGRQVAARERMAILTRAKDPGVLAALAASAGFTFDGEFVAL